MMSKYIRILSYSLFAVCLLTILSILIAHRLRELGALSWGEFVLGAATLVLGFSTYFLGYTGLVDGELNRKQVIELAEKDRRRLRLKEQLEGLYSPLMSCIDFIDNRGEHKVEPLLSLMPKLRGKFEFLAKEDLKELLREYYGTDKTVLNKAEWDELISGMADAIGIGCSNISIEYDDLTRKVT